MYKLHLILKYLRKRRIAWVSLLAVMLCTAMVLVVISVMGGWLRMFRTSFHGLSGDIIVSSGTLAGFPHYDEMIAEIQKIPEVEAAAPVIQTFGLININARKTAGVQVFGYPPEQIGQVNNFPKSLWRQYNQWMEWADGKPIYPEDRIRIRDLYGLDVRPSEKLLELTTSERDRLRGSIDKAKTIAAEMARAVAKETDPAKHFEAQREADDARYIADYIKRMIDSPQGSAVDPLTRKEVRKMLGPVMDNPDERLAPNDAEKKMAREQGLKMVQHPSFNLFLPPEAYKRFFKSANPKAKQTYIDEAPTWQGMIAGVGVVNIRKNHKGELEGRGNYLYELPVSLTVMGVSPDGRFDVGSKAERNYWIVDTSRTKVWQYDSNTVYVPFAVLQKDLGMDPQTATEADGKQITIPGRTSEIHVRVKKPAADSAQGLIAARNAVQIAVERVLERKEKEGTPFRGVWPEARTWEQSQAKWLGAIEKEMVLVTGLFGLISVVAVFLIFCIFYMIVVEKTRDIGIVKSVGATSSGVASIFLGYGAAIGIVGAGLGFLLAYGIVHNINEIHAWMGQVMKVQIWDPEVYAFDTIPNTMDPSQVVMILIVAVLASVIGALVPALRAAKLNPVEALRWE